MSVYESPIKRRLRAAVEDAHDESDFAAQLIDAIDNNPEVRAAVLHLVRRATAAAPQRATTTRGRGR